MRTIPWVMANGRKFIRSEYDRWSDSHSEVYDIWSDFGSDIYDFWSDLRGDLFSGDIDKAQKEAAKFQEDIDKLLG